MNEKNKRKFVMASCITSYSVILTNMNGMEMDNIVSATIITTFLVMVLIVTAYIFIGAVEDKVEEGDETDES